MLLLNIWTFIILKIMFVCLSISVSVPSRIKRDSTRREDFHFYYHINVQLSEQILPCQKWLSSLCRWCWIFIIVSNTFIATLYTRTCLITNYVICNSNNMLYLFWYITWYNLFGRYMYKKYVISYNIVEYKRIKCCYYSVAIVI